MSFISTGVEYALHCLLYLTKPMPGTTESNVRDLAEFQGIPAEYLAKIFTKLHKAGLVIATEGARGGFTLGRQPESITINDVIVAVDGNKPLFECREIRTRSALFENSAPAWVTRDVCTIHAIMLEAEAKMRESLSQRTLADLATQVAGVLPKNHGEQVLKWFDSRPAALRRHK